MTASVPGNMWDKRVISIVPSGSDLQVDVQDALQMEASEDGNGAVTLAIRGEIDFGNVAALRARLSELIRSSTGPLTVDLAEVDFVDSTTIGVLIQAKKRLTQSERDFRIAQPKPGVRRTIELAGLVDYLGL
jgi:anti-sigma B factor antagonist